MLQDQLNRSIKDLRISVIDKCNFRCTYCMPKEIFKKGYPFIPKKNLLTFDEIIKLVNIFVGFGVKKIRLTGGEPLLRPNIEELVANLIKIKKIDDIAMTTNGFLLKNKAHALREAGLKRITVSLDSINEHRFKQINGRNYSVKPVLEGINAAKEAGFKHIKINAVIQKNVDPQDIIQLCDYFRGSGHILRFIEYMDVGTVNEWQLSDVIYAAKILQIIHRHAPLKKLAPQHRGEVARRYEYLDGQGEIGLITSISKPFCDDCNRARLSADGNLYTCLFSNIGHDLRTLLRDKKSLHAVRSKIQKIWTKRDDQYSAKRLSGIPIKFVSKVEMFKIGG